MLSLRGVTTGAVVLFISGVAINVAVAQTATTDAPGKPLQLLRIIEAPARPKAVAHNRIHAALHRATAMRNLKRHTVVAEAKVEQSEPTVQDASPPGVSVEDADTAPPTTFAAAEPAPHRALRQLALSSSEISWSALPRRRTSMPSILPPIKPAPHRRMRAPADATPS